MRASMGSGRSPCPSTPDALARLWADSVVDLDRDIGRDALRAAYRLTQPEHSYQNGRRCKKNCKSNPRCYSGLGEHRWLDPKKVGPSEATTDVVLVKEEKRSLTFPAGLVNLGNTCYVNSFLQIWFSNVWLREALYAWNPFEDPEEKDNKTLATDLKFQPKSKVGSLQALFSLMEFSQRSALDPNDFVTKLGLDPQVQQDAQEFSKLFMTLLESCLASQTNPKVKNIVKNQFSGEYAYVTTCSVCERESRSLSQFNELLLIIQGKRTLLECIEDFLSVEVLDGDNKFFCEDCGMKQPVTRCVRITQLPPVLNLSLNRFIFDVKTGSRKKLNSAILFPKELDMSDYLGKPPGTLIYSLTGVLIHIGDNAHQGHYKAHVQNLRTGDWFQYSDKVIESLRGFESQLGSAIEMNESKSSKKARAKNPGSSTAYMLVYTSKNSLELLEAMEKSPLKNGTNGTYDENILEGNLKRSHPNGDNGNVGDALVKKKRFRIMKPFIPNEEGDVPFKADSGVSSLSNSQYPSEASRESSLSTTPSLTPEPTDEVDFPRDFPDHLKTLVNLDNLDLQNELHNERAQKISDDRNREILSVQMVDILSSLSLEEDDDDYEFVPTSWLKCFISNPKECKEMHTNAFLCFHKNLDFEKLHGLKVISSNACGKLFMYLPNLLPEVRLTSDMLCKKCTQSRCRTLQLDSRSARDAKIIQEMLKEPVLENDGIKYWVGKNSIKRWRSLAQDYLVKQIYFESGKLYLNSSLSDDEAMGDESLDQVREAKQESEGDADCKEGAEDPDAIESDEEGNQASKPLKDKIQDPNDFKVEFNADVLCKHGGLSVEVTKRRLVNLDLWNIFKSYFPDCPEFPDNTPLCKICEDDLCLVKSISRENQSVAAAQKTALSDIFNEKNRPTWSKHSLKKVFILSRSFVNAWKLWVRNPNGKDRLTTIGNEVLLCEHKKISHHIDLDTETDQQSVIYMISEEEWATLAEHFDIDYAISMTRNPSGNSDENFFTFVPEICWECIQLRRLQEEEEKLIYKDAAVFIRKLVGTEKPPEEDPSDPDFYETVNGVGQNAKRQRIPSSVSIVRRSNRRQRVRGERELKISSDMLLKDLKVRIMKLFNIPTYDQVLCLNGCYLTDSKQTLAELRVFPSSTIYLLNDDSPQNTIEEPVVEGLEEGFKGTGLLGSVP